MFDWENHLDGNSTMLDIHEFVLKRAKENNLSLEDITVFPKALDHSLKDKALVLNVWATYLSKHVETKDQTANKSLNQHMNKLTSTYMHRDNPGSNYPTLKRRKRKLVDITEKEAYLFQELREKKARTRSILPDSKTKVFEHAARMKNVDSSQISMSSASSIVCDKFGNRSIKNGCVIINVESIFVTNFPRMKVNVMRSERRNGGPERNMHGYIAHGVIDQSGVIIPSGDCDFLPQSLQRTNERNSRYGHYWYSSKEDAKCALMWYCLYSHANVKWRRKWLEFVLGDGNDEIQVNRTNFKKCDARFVLKRIDVVGL
jgi:hypothetical protein